MEILDQPTALKYSNGKVSPDNVILMGYIFLGLSVFFLFLGAVYIVALFVGIFGVLFSMFLSFTTYGVEFFPEKRYFENFTILLGFMRVNKKVDLNKFQFITVLPLKQTSSVYANTYLSTTITDYKHAVCLLNVNYRNKQELIIFENKSKAEEIAKELAHCLSLEYFDYDPKLIREKLSRR